MTKSRHEIRKPPSSAILSISRVGHHGQLSPNVRPRGRRPHPGPNAPSKKECPPFRGGSFAIDYYQLYPENADWDPDSCLLWIGALWNATVAT